MDGIQVEYFYPALPDVLWRALTERAKIAGWWGENDFVPETGHRFTVSAIGLAALAGPIQCTVLELEPGRRLAMSWQVGTTHATVSLLVEAGRQRQRAGGDPARERRAGRPGRCGAGAAPPVRGAAVGGGEPGPGRGRRLQCAPPLSSLSLWGSPSLSDGLGVRVGSPSRPPAVLATVWAPRLRRPRVGRPAQVWPAVAIARGGGDRGVRVPARRARPRRGRVRRCARSVRRRRPGRDRTRRELRSGLPGGRPGAGSGGPAQPVGSTRPTRATRTTRPTRSGPDHGVDRPGPDRRADHHQPAARPGRPPLRDLRAVERHPDLVPGGRDGDQHRRTRAGTGASSRSG